MRRFTLVALLVSAEMLNSQEAFEPGLFQTFVEKVSISTEIGTFFRRSDYGSQGSLRIDLSIAKMTSNVLFGGDLSVFAGVGMGARYRMGDLARPLNIKSYFVGISVPIVDFAPVVGLRHPFVLRASPFYQNALTRNYSTGNHNPVQGFGGSISLTGFITEYLGLGVHVTRFEGRQPKAGFVWDTNSESVGFGVTVNLGKLLSDHRLTRESLTEVRETLSERSIAFEWIRMERDSLARMQSASRDSLLRAAVLLSELVEANAIERPQALPVANSPLESSPLDQYDENRKAPVRIIKIDKQLFRGSDLVEEPYLKAILSIISKHSDYVWEIAYRDAAGDGSQNGGRLADKIRHFFQIYDSHLDRRLAIAHDRSLRTEFEIRCLGLAKQDISDAF